MPNLARPSGRSVVHRARVHEWTPSAITCLNASRDGNRLAAGRENGNIEIWTVAGSSSVCDQCISGKPGGAPRSLVWKSATKQHPVDRLFSAGDGGEVVEWDLATLSPKSVERSFGGIIWALAIDPSETLLAAACDDGAVRIYNILDCEGIEFAFSLTKQEARLLSIAWDPKGERVVTGGADGSLRIWDVERKCTVLRISAGQAKRKRANPVWAVAVLGDSTVVSGDDQGQVQLFEPTNGSRMKIFEEHQSHVRALAVDHERRLLFSAGTDATILKYSLASDDEWVVSEKRSNLHTHDIRSLTCAAGRIFSGGSDTIIFGLSTGSAFTTNRPTKIVEIPRQLVHISPESGLALFQYDRRVELRAILAERSETAMFDDHDERSLYPLAEIRIGDGERNLVSSAFAGDAKRCLVAVSDGSERTLLFRVEAPPSTTLLATARAACEDREVDSPSVHPVPLPPKISGAYSLSFTRDGRRLVVAGSRGSLHIVDTTSDEAARLLNSFPLAQAALNPLHPLTEEKHDSARGLDRKRPPVFGMVASNDKPGPPGPVAVSTDGQWAAVANQNNRLLVFNLDTMKLDTDLGVLEGRLTALAFHPRSPSSLVAVCASKRFFIFDVEKGGLSEWSREYSSALPDSYMQAPGQVTGVAFDPDRPSVILLSSPRWLCSVDLDKVCSNLVCGRAPYLVNARGM
eukprot:tig00000852_g5050.t1